MLLILNVLLNIYLKLKTSFYYISMLMFATISFSTIYRSI